MAINMPKRQRWYWGSWAGSLWACELKGQRGAPSAFRFPAILGLFITPISLIVSGRLSPHCSPVWEVESPTMEPSCYLCNKKTAPPLCLHVNVNKEEFTVSSTSCMLHICLTIDRMTDPEKACYVTQVKCHLIVDPGLTWGIFYMYSQEGLWGVYTFNVVQFTHVFFVLCEFQTLTSRNQT